MKVYNETKTIKLDKYDLTKGYLKEDILVTILPEQQEEKEEWHYETIATYLNGGKDVKKIIDKNYIPYLPERQEEEKIHVYIEYSNEELEKIGNQKESQEIEKWFVKYDKICNEHARCQRLGIECHHNIEELDIQAVEKAKRLKELRTAEMKAI